MATLFLDSEPVVETWLAERRAKGLDGRDEVWEGVYHVAPYEHSRNGDIGGQLVIMIAGRARRAGLRLGLSFNLGSGPEDFRVPDLGYHRNAERLLYMPTAALVIEVLSPSDESYAKLEFYAVHGVDEVWVLDPAAHRVEIRELVAGTYAQTDHSSLLDLDAATVAAELDWPA